jgi:hypothetical protein
LVKQLNVLKYLKLNKLIKLNNIDFNKWSDDLINTTTDIFNNKLFVAIFDLPARAKAVNMISHTGYFACINCEIEGIYDFNKVCYPFKKKLVLRDKIKYNLCLKEVEYKKSKSSLIKQGECNFSGIKGSTVLTENLDILQDVVYDYMHQCCEGYVKRFIKLILTSPNKKRILKVKTDYYIGIPPFDYYLIIY